MTPWWVVYNSDAESREIEAEGSDQHADGWDIDVDMWLTTKSEPDLLILLPANSF
jgi:hypothetical protein